MSESKFKIIEDPEYNFRRLEPIPAPSELNDFYESKYFSLIKKGGRASEMRKLIETRNHSNPELKWLERTLYKDICQILRELDAGKNLFDVGCGTGDFLRYAGSQGFVASGIDPSQEGFNIAQSIGIDVQQSTLEEYVKNPKRQNFQPFDIITLLNVLEHLPDPDEVIENIKIILRPGGIICIRVPNDFSEIQMATQKKLDIKPWWVAIPDHVNYFNFKSLKEFLKKCGFDVVYLFSDFPMEFFLLMDENYVKNAKKGRECHQKRVAFELSMPSDLRRRLYKSFAELGIGRNSLVFARRNI
jgi:2-polyprenyl-3-methyl-5-hydroxy-6-metoxy-1,4-benzoquinol methylase